MLNDEKLKYLENIYFDPKLSGSYSGPDKLYRFIKQHGKYSISKADVKKWIQSQEVYPTNRLIKHKIKRRRVITPYIDYMWDSDTASLNNYKKDNSGYGYFVLVIDIMSRFVWTQAVKTPSGKEIKAVFENIFKTKRIPEKIRTDQGTEFSNKTVQNLFRLHNIHHFVTHNEVKANYAERAIQTIKGKIMRYLRSKQSTQWVEVLPQITHAYNTSYHRSIKKAPISISKSDENDLWEELYASNPTKLTKNKSFKFKIGDTVRISKLRKPFQRYYSEHWTNEIFIIRNKTIKEYIPTYNLSDYAGESISGIFYEEELQQVFVDENTKYNIEKILKKRTRNKRSESLVKWMGWPAKFNSWIPKEDIESYK